MGFHIQLGTKTGDRLEYTIHPPTSSSLPEGMPGLPKGLRVYNAFEAFFVNLFDFLTTGAVKIKGEKEGETYWVSKGSIFSHLICSQGDEANYENDLKQIKQTSVIPSDKSRPPSIDEVVTAFAEKTPHRKLSKIYTLAVEKLSPDVPPAQPTTPATTPATAQANALALPPIETKHQPSNPVTISSEIVSPISQPTSGSLRSISSSSESRPTPSQPSAPPIMPSSEAALVVPEQPRSDAPKASDTTPKASDTIRPLLPSTTPPPPVETPQSPTHSVQSSPSQPAATGDVPPFIKTLSKTFPPESVQKIIDLREKNGVKNPPKYLINNNEFTLVWDPQNEKNLLLLSDGDLTHLHVGADNKFTGISLESSEPLLTAPPENIDAVIKALNEFIGMATPKPVVLPPPAPSSQTPSQKPSIPPTVAPAQPLMSKITLDQPLAYLEKTISDYDISSILTSYEKNQDIAEFPSQLPSENGFTLRINDDGSKITIQQGNTFCIFTISEKKITEISKSDFPTAQRYINAFKRFALAAQPRSVHEEKE